MRIGRNLPKSFYNVGRVPSTPEAAYRHRIVASWEALRKRGVSVGEACDAVGEAKSNVYRWRARLRQLGPEGLADRSRRPRRVRQPTWSAELVQVVQELRERYPRWGKDKLVVLLRRAGWAVSTSMVGRILTWLKARGLLREPPGPGRATRRRRRQRPYAVRKPRQALYGATPAEYLATRHPNLAPLSHMY